MRVRLKAQYPSQGKGSVIKNISPNNCHIQAHWLSWITAGFLILGTIWQQARWNNYSPVRETVSSLAAIGVPSRLTMNLITLIGAIFFLAIAVKLDHCGSIGRIFIGVAGIGLIGVAAFPVPSVTEDSALHTAAATLVLVLMCLWPVAAHFGDRSHLWGVSIRKSVISTVVLAVAGIFFWVNWLIETPVMGLVERCFLVMQLGFLIALIGTSKIKLATEICQPNCAVKPGLSNKI